MFLPSVPVLLDLASQLERQRDHVLGKPHREADGLDDALLAAANRTQDEPGEDERSFQSLGADAELDHVIYDGSAYGTAVFAGSDEEQDYLGLPGLLDPTQMRDLLRRRQQAQVAERSAAASAPPAPEPARDPRTASVVAGELAALRRELNGLDRKSTRLNSSHPV